tara:strand:- start:7692 stop:8255 length:564 start_codon:yes stop_codon:yes gene_type:complete
MSDDNNFIPGYDVCVYQKYNCREHGPWDILGEEVGNNILIASIKSNNNTDSINPIRLKSFFCSLNLIHDSYINSVDNLGKQNKQSCRAAVSLKAVDDWNKLKYSSGSWKPKMKLGFMYKYKFANMIIGIDKTYLIVNLQNKFREINRLKKIKANIIHRYWRKCSWNPSYKLGYKLVEKRALKDQINY